jgi:hypothetical protein
MYLLGNIQSGDSMQDKTEEHLKQDLLAEIQNLEGIYGKLKTYVAGAQYDTLEIGANLQSFKDSLNRASAFILTLYNLKGQKIKIPWEQLFTNLDYALATIAVSSTVNPRSAIKLALTMSEPKIQDVMAYLHSLKESLT